MDNLVVSHVYDRGYVLMSRNLFKDRLMWDPELWTKNNVGDFRKINSFIAEVRVK